MKLPDGVIKLLNEITDDASFSRYQSVGRALAKMNLSALEVPEESRVHIAVLSSFTIDALVAFLQVWSLKGGLLPAIYLGGFDQYRQAFLDTGSDLYAFRPEILYLMLELESLLPGISLRPLGHIDIESVIEKISALAETFKKNASGILVIGDFIVPHQFPFSIHMNEAEKAYWHLNEALYKRFKDDARIFIAELNRLAAYHGLSRVINPRLKLLASMAWSETFIPQVAKLCLAYIKALKRKTRKCLVLDLDNTLWGGIIGEEGLNGIQLGPEGIGRAYYEFQKTILALYNQGIVLAINSKNNYDDAMEAIREHPYMLLRETHFGSLQINWDDKVTNMNRIANQLNIGLDSLVFIDDSPQERLLIRRELPEVLVIEMPNDPALYSTTLASLNDFEQLYLTAEDRERGVMYAQERSRRELEARSTNLGEYLESLKMKLIIRQSKENELERVAQLIQRTNQFNLTTRRHSLSEIQNMWNSPKFRIYTLRVSDIFGDSGLTGVAIVRVSNDDIWTLDTLLMSCRVMGRTIEYEFLNQIALDAQTVGVSFIRGQYIPSPKNKSVADLFARFGFRELPSEGESTFWELSLSGSKIVSLPRFEVQR